MVNYPDLSNLSNSSGVAELMKLPNSSYPHFWAWIITGIWFIITATLYFKEKERGRSGKLLSAMSVSCFAIISLSTIGTFLGIITVDIMIYVLVFSLSIIGIWFFTSNN